MNGRARLAKMLATKRAMLQLDCRTVAKQIGLNHTTYWRMEQGRGADTAHVLTVCRWLGVSVEYAMTGMEARESCSRCMRTETVLTMVRTSLAALDDGGARGDGG